MAPMGYIHDEYCAACNDVSPTDVHKKRAPCRYYQTGNCRRGSGCPFPHVSLAAHVEAFAIPHPAYAADPMYPYYSPGQTPAVYRPLTSQAYPAFLWQPYAPLSPSFDPRYGPACPVETPPDYPDDRSDPSSAESSSAVTSIEYQLRIAMDAARLEGTESDPGRGVACPQAEHRLHPSPGRPGYRPPFFPGITPEQAAHDPAALAQHHDQGAMVARSAPPLLPCQDDTKKKPLAYKTKPCKFYTASGKCTSGEKCTFIHDPESTGDPAELSSPKTLSPPSDAQLPPKPLNKYDDCRARDFYPITWRVIGGGVMMGGQRQTCPAFATGHCKHGDDCKLAHETELKADLGFIALEDEPVGKGVTPKRGRSGSQKRKFIKVPPPEIQTLPLPSATPRPQPPDASAAPHGGIDAAKKESDEVVALPPTRDAPASPLHRRTRSMSMVRPPPPPVDVPHSNYAAEL